MNKLVLLAVSVLLAFPSISSAQDKVVVIPMASSNKIANSIYGGGYILPDGSISSSFGKSYTVTHAGPGSYNIFMAGVRPGCSGPWPINLATCFGTGFCNSFFMMNNCLTGDVTIGISTSNTAGTPVDMGFFTLLMEGDPEQTAAAATTAHHSYQTCELNAATGVETCR